MFIFRYLGRLNMLYKQCLVKSFSESKLCWLPEKFAKKNKVITFKDDGYKQFWEVFEVYNAIRLTEEKILKRKDDYKKQRDVSDI